MAPGMTVAFGDMSGKPVEQEKLGAERDEWQVTIFLKDFFFQT